jgi:membrane-associated PAP2 superfamily phosphatase
MAAALMGNLIEKVRVWHVIVMAVLALAFTLYLFEITNLDLILQDRFYTGHESGWTVDSKAPIPRMIFYTGPKSCLILIGFGLLGFILASFMKSFTGLQKYRRGLCFILLTALMVPAVVALIKETSNVFCPYELQRYGDQMPYYHLFENHSDTISRQGRGFPAGHASGGFGLLGIGFIWRSTGGRVMGFSIPFILGWIMGLYQMLRGAHFLSHTIVTMEIAVILTMSFYGVIFSGFSHFLISAGIFPDESEGK